MKMKSKFLAGAVAVCLALGCLSGCDEKSSSLEGIEVYPESARINLGEILRIEVAPVPRGADAEFTWKSENAEIASVSNYAAVSFLGIVEAEDVGNTQIVISSGNFSKTVPIEVYEVTLQEKITALGVKGAWLFEDAGNLELATAGQKLTAYKMDGNRSAGSPSLEGFAQVPGPTKRNHAVRVPKQSYFLCNHGFAAAGNGKVTEYTLLIDVKVPKLQQYYSIFETDNLSLGSDGDFFIRPGADWGIRGNYTDKTRFEANKWFRMVVTVKGGKAKYYLNGKLIDEKEPGVDSHASWLPEGVLLFADEDGEDNEFDIASVAIWDKALGDGDIATLGGL
ncbi:MAG: Ig-like domain-containing protein [Tannerella sp.]|nr:Ig-like domain-containing protein [Tannerella sp.]